MPPPDPGLATPHTLGVEGQERKREIRTGSTPWQFITSYGVANALVISTAGTDRRKMPHFGPPPAYGPERGLNEQEKLAAWISRQRSHNGGSGWA